MISQEDRQVRAGEQPLFTVESLEVELRVGVEMTSRFDDPTQDGSPRWTPGINFDPQVQERSVIKFRVEMKPLEPEG
jgi:hypothetical protein